MENKTEADSNVKIETEYPHDDKPSTGVFGVSHAHAVFSAFIFISLCSTCRL